MLAYAHDGLHPAQALTVWNAWTLDPLVLALLALAALLYARGTASSWRRAGVGRGVRRWEAACFAAGMAGLFAALVWPLDALGEALFSAHMAQHTVMMNLAAPLLVLGAPLQVMIRALPAAWRLAAARLVPRAGLVGATLLQQAVLWAWHTPAGVAWALESEPVHIVMHASLLLAALLFWTAVLRPRGARYWGPIAALLVTLKVSGVVCIVLLINPEASYTAYGQSAAAWGLSAAEDEQLGWGVMMSLGSLSYLAAALALAGAGFRSLERGHGAAGSRA